MNRRRPLLPLLPLTLALVSCPAAGAEPPAGGAEPAPAVVHRGNVVAIFTSDVVIPEGTRRVGDVTCIGGTVRIDGTLTGEVVVIAGSLTVTGSVGGSAVGVLSDVAIEDGRVGGDLINILGDYRAEGARIGRQIVDWSFGGDLPGLGRILFWARFGGLLLTFVLLVLIVVVAPDRVARIADAAPARYASAFFVGLLAYVLLSVVFVLVTATLIGLPIALLAYFVFKWLGIAGVFLAIGRRLGRALGREMSALGAVLLVFAIWSALLLVPSAFGIAGLVVIALLRLGFLCLVDIPALGLVLLTRAGSRTSKHPPARTAPPPPPLPEPSPAARP